MIKFYLWLNAALYLIFALICTFRPPATAQSLGYVALNHSGQSEYLVIYGGLQIGLALGFAYLASSPALYAAGIVFSLCLYLPIVIYRIITLLAYSPVGVLTVATGGLELLLLLGATVLFFRR